MLLFIALVAACTSDGDSTNTVPPPSESAEVTPTLESGADAPSSVLQSTSSVTAMPTEISFTTADDAYYLAVSYAIDAPDQDNGNRPPDGFRWLLVVATLANRSGAQVTVNTGNLILNDSAGEHYFPEAPDNETQPPLVTAVLDTGVDILGIARFAIPFDATPESLSWCLDDECQTMIQAPLP
jgi:hypothetical protein